MGQEFGKGWFHGGGEEAGTGVLRWGSRVDHRDSVAGGGSLRPGRAASRLAAISRWGGLAAIFWALSSALPATASNAPGPRASSQRLKPSAAIPPVEQAGLAGQGSSQDGAAASSSNYTMNIYADESTEVVDEVMQTLTGWASSAARNDVRGEVGFYAPKLERYFLRRNVSKDFVQGDKQAFLDRGNKLETYTLSNYRFEAMSEDEVTVSFAKSWVVLDRASNEAKARSGRSRLWLERQPEGWKITGEQDLKVVKR